MTYATSRATTASLQLEVDRLRRQLVTAQAQTKHARASADLWYMAYRDLAYPEEANR